MQKQYNETTTVNLAHLHGVNNIIKLNRQFFENKNNVKSFVDYSNRTDLELDNKCKWHAITKIYS